MLSRVSVLSVSVSVSVSVSGGGARGAGWQGILCYIILDLWAGGGRGVVNGRVPSSPPPPPRE